MSTNRKILKNSNMKSAVRAGALGLSLHMVGCADPRTDKLELKINKLMDFGRLQLEALEAKDEISLSSRSFQYIDDFSIIVTEITQELTGLRLVGKVLNIHSVTYTDVRMRVTILNSGVDFRINQIDPGKAAVFSIYVPDVPIKTSSGLAEVKVLGHMVSYRNQ